MKINKTTQITDKIRFDFRVVFQYLKLNPLFKWNMVKFV